jgi:hypothetical protein
VSWKTDLIKAVATVKANTENHNGELKEFKEDFKAHKEAEAKDTLYMKKKIQTLQLTIATIDCPHTKAMEELEAQHDQKILDDADSNKLIEGRISSLEANKKYNLISVAGIYTLLGIILKKIYTGH